MYGDSITGMIFGFVFGLIGTVILLVVELVVTILAYTYLNLKSVETFGYLVRQSQHVLDLIKSHLIYWLPESADAAYATLLGELGPKAILLLLMGLVVASIIRMLISLFKPLFGSSS